MEVTVEPKINVQNMVASSDLYGELNLDKIAFTVDNAEFEPEQFPGLVFRMTKPKVVFLLFRSGKIVCTGAKREEDIRTAIMNLLATLRKLKVIKER
jgi:transcription initiation factor TFIID TATA-box-binding protein